MRAASTRASTPPLVISRSVKMEWTISRDYIRTTILSLAVLMPTAFIAAPEPWRALGYVYWACWWIVMLPIMAGQMAIALDCVLMLTHRFPLFLPRALIERGIYGHDHHRRVARGVHTLARWTFVANPFSNLTLALLLYAIRIRASLMARVIERVNEEVALRRTMAGLRPNPDPGVEFTAPYVDRVERELPSDPHLATV